MAASAATIEILRIVLFIFLNFRGLKKVRFPYLSFQRTGNRIASLCRMLVFSYFSFL